MSVVEPSAGTAVPLHNEDFSRSVNALFETRDHAETARRDLLAAGIPERDIVLIAAEAPPEAETTSSGGFWETLAELFMPDEDRDRFAEGVKRGGITVAVKTDTANHDRVVDILDRDGAVDLDEREESWRNDGWTGYTAQDPLSPASPPRVVLDENDMSYTPASAGTAGFRASVADRFPVGEHGAPPVESPGALPPEALTGETEPPAMSSGDRPYTVSRDLSHGRTRVRSYRRDAGDLPTAGEGI